MNVQLPEQWERFVHDEVRNGRFPSVAAVLEEALSLLKQRDQHQAWPEAAEAAEVRSIGAIVAQRPAAGHH